MNERIRECMFNAGLNSNYVEGFDSIYSQQLAKFAELIVKECVNVVDDMADPEDSERYFWAIRNVSQKIKDHFGVE